MAKQPLVRIGTRASKLALTQSGMMQRKIAVALGFDEADAHDVAPLVQITTSGDRIQDRRLLEAGGKGLFTKEIEEALLDGRIDCAIHSLKDVPSVGPTGLVIAAYPEREDPRDAFVSVKYATFEDLPQGAVLGTASLRRQTQSLFVRPDLDVEVMRGNVDTRLAKLERGEADAIILAYAGLRRLGLADRARQLLDPVARPPAPGQGCLAIQMREHDAGADWVAKINHHPTALAIAAERGALEALEGSCRTAIGAHARLVANDIDIVVEALTPDGRERFRREAS
ncbi:MAG TPA: hydroxymethylbilane synthase, partial [Caulobacteraceae bacterium]|nr:hydroxymethylbilane synthase [Caulobacteraceae bacterium]